jgi:hypothetical protein
MCSFMTSPCCCGDALSICGTVNPRPLTGSRRDPLIRRWGGVFERWRSCLLGIVEEQVVEMEALSVSVRRRNETNV